jgi:hypothetical protein
VALASVGGSQVVTSSTDHVSVPVCARPVAAAPLPATSKTTSTASRVLETVIAVGKLAVTPSSSGSNEPPDPSGERRNRTVKENSNRADHRESGYLGPKRLDTPPSVLRRTPTNTTDKTIAWYRTGSRNNKLLDQFQHRYSFIITVLAITCCGGTLEPW